MKSHGFYSVLAATVLTTVLPFCAHAGRTGGGSDGGGNLEEIDFKYRSTDIEKILTANNVRVSQVLGVEAAALVEAIASTNSECAKGEFLATMDRENKLFWFDSASNTIYLDCSRYFSAVNSRSPEIVKGLILHEYARKISGESSDYRVSRYSKELFNDLSKADPAVRGQFPERFARIFSIGVSIGEVAARAQADYEKANKLTEERTQDEILNRAYCFQPSGNHPKISSLFGKGPGLSLAQAKRPEHNTWAPEFFAHSSEERCQVFKIPALTDDAIQKEVYGIYLKPEEIAVGYSPRVPQIRGEILRREVMLKKYVPELERVSKDALDQLTAIARDPSQTPLDRSLAVAMKKTIQKRGGVNSLFYDIQYVMGMKVKAVNTDALARFQDTVTYLAFVAADHLHETGGDLNVYREFNLEIEVRDLNEKVNYAIELASRALVKAELANGKIDQMRRREIIRSAAFWSIAGLTAWLAL